MPRLLIIVLLASLAAAQQQPLDPMYEDSIDLRSIAFAVFEYAQTNNTLPPTLGDTYPLLAATADSADVLRRHYISALDDAPEEFPADPAAWINEHASYDYLPRPGITLSEVPEWGEVIIAHLDLAKGHPVDPTPGNPEGLVFPLLMLDGHTEIVGAAEARLRVDESKRVFEALATGGPLPPRYQSIWNARTIIGAILAYADANNDILPPTLGAVLPYMKTDDKRTPTLRDKARAFLSPDRAERTFIPEDPTPEWIDRNASYTYLGSADVLRAWIEDPAHTILLRADWPVEIPGQEPRFAIATGAGQAANQLDDYVDWITAESTRVIDAVRRGTRLPDLHHTVRDLRLIAAALEAYADANNDALPDTLGQLLDYIPDEPLTDAYAPLTPRSRALVFLSPADEAGVTPPESPTPDWVDRKSSYKWLGAGVTLSALRNNPIPAILHAPLDQPIKTRMPYAEDVVVPYVDPFGTVIIATSEWAETVAAESKAAMADRN